jgi:hypothetical protein
MSRSILSIVLAKVDSGHASPEDKILYKYFKIYLLQECNLLDSLMTWLICSAGDETYESYSKGEKSSWTLTELQELIVILLHKRYVTCLAMGFSIFQKVGTVNLKCLAAIWRNNNFSVHSFVI